MGTSVQLDGLVLEGTCYQDLGDKGENWPALFEGDVLGMGACDVSAGTRPQGSWSVRRPLQL